MTPPATVVLDNEPVQALVDVAHPKHRRVLAFLDEVNRRSRGGREVSLLVPVAVRIEAGWDRSDTRAAAAIRISGARDVALDRGRADRATRLRIEAPVSVVGATVAEVAGAAVPPVVVLTSDVADMERLAGHLEAPVRFLRV